MFTFLTFNIRYDCGQDGNNNFCYRKPLIQEKLTSEKPDICCFQEVLPSQFDWLEEILPKYTVVGVGRKEKMEGEGIAVAVKKERFHLIELEPFWLSRTPNMPGSRYEIQSSCPRVTQSVLLKDREDGHFLRVINTHFDHMYAETRQLEFRQITAKIADESLCGDAPMIFCGDLNCEPCDHETVEFMTEHPDLKNASVDVGKTSHEFGRFDDEDAYTQIDYIFIRGLESIKCIKWTDCRDGVFLSDHYPVVASLEYID